MNEYKFDCSQCGKCCFVSPHLNPLEIFDFSDKFVIQMAHHAQFSLEKNPLPKEQIKHLERLGHTISIPEFNKVMFYYVDFATIKYPTVKQCDMLDKNLCSINHNKPLICQLNPISPYYSEQEQEKHFQIWDSFKFFDCNKVENNTIIWKDNKINHVGNQIRYKQHVENISKFTDLYVQYLNHLSTPNNEILNDHFKTIYKVAEQDQVILGDMIIALHALTYYGIIDQDSAILFIENQIKVIDEKIKFALLRFNKEDRQTTNLLRKQKESYLKALKDNSLFENNNFGVNI